MGKKRAKKGAAATRQEVEKAIESMTPGEQLKLLEHARGCAWALRQRGRGVDDKDLVQEAIDRALDGRRNWYPQDLSFTDYLNQVISSLRSHEITKVKGMVAVSAVRGGEEGVAKPVYETIEAPQSGPEDQALAAAALRGLREAFKDDQLVLDIMDGLEGGMKGPEIQEVLGVTATEYNTALRRLRRHVQRKEEK